MKSMDGKFHIKLQIVGRYYPLVIERKDEERFRKAAKLINDKVAQYKQRYRDKDIQDFLSMAALQFVLRELELEEKRVSVVRFDFKLLHKAQVENAKYI